MRSRGSEGKGCIHDGWKMLPVSPQRLLYSCAVYTNPQRLIDYSLNSYKSLPLAPIMLGFRKRQQRDLFSKVYP